MEIPQNVLRDVYALNHKRIRTHSKRVKFAYSHGVELAGRHIPKNTIYGRDTNGEYWFCINKQPILQGECPIVFRFNGDRWYKCTMSRDLLSAVLKFAQNNPEFIFSKIESYNTHKMAEQVAKSASKDVVRKFKGRGLAHKTRHEHDLQIGLDMWETVACSSTRKYAHYSEDNGARPSVANM